MNPIFEFKTENLKEEFEKLDNRLRTILFALAGYVYYKYGKTITLTELYRPQSLQDAYYKDNPMYQQSPWASVHQYWRGADIRIIYFTESEVIDIMKFLEQFEYGTEKHTGLIHDIGQGKHLHVQVSPRDTTTINKI